MAHYYVNFVNPPPFGELLPKAIGYISTGGVIVLYGKKEHDPVLQMMIERAMAAKRIPIETGGNFNAKPAPQLMHIPKKRPVSSAIKVPKPVACMACGLERGFRNMTRHHIIPKALGKRIHKTIKLCKPCHASIHKLPHRHVAAMTIPEQLEFIKRDRALC